MAEADPNMLDAHHPHSRSSFWANTGYADLPRKTCALYETDLSLELQTPELFWHLEVSRNLRVLPSAETHLPSSSLRSILESWQDQRAHTLPARPLQSYYWWRWCRPLSRLHHPPWRIWWYNRWWSLQHQQCKVCPSPLLWVQHDKIVRLSLLVLLKINTSPIYHRAMYLCALVWFWCHVQHMPQRSHYRRPRLLRPHPEMQGSLCERSLCFGIPW